MYIYIHTYKYIQYTEQFIEITAQLLVPQPIGIYLIQKSFISVECEPFQSLSNCARLNAYVKTESHLYICIPAVPTTCHNA